MERNKYIIVLGAGKGYRMESLNENYSKVAYPILGKPLINYVLDAAKPLNAKKTIVVVGFGKEQTIKSVQGQAEIVEQKEVIGTGHAVMQAMPKLENEDGDVFILCGDTPLLTTDTLNKIYHKHVRQGNALTICSTVIANPTGYGRVIREKGSYRLLEVRPYAEINDEEKELEEINSGIYIVDLKLLKQTLPLLSKDNKKNEYYLSDIVKILSEQGHQIDAFVLEDPEDIYNINDRVQLAYAGKVLRKRINQKLMYYGVSIEDPETTYISPNTVIGKDTVIKPNTSIIGESIIGYNNIIGPNAYLEHVKIGNNNLIPSVYLKDVEIKDNEIVEPFTGIKKC